MLVLTRRIGESLKIGDDITVTILGVHGNQVRLGVEAPRHVRVDREEVRARINNEQTFNKDGDGDDDDGTGNK